MLSCERLNCPPPLLDLCYWTQSGVWHDLEICTLFAFFSWKTSPISFDYSSCSPGIIEGTETETPIRLPPVQVRPFNSMSGSGNTTWQILSQEASIAHPPPMQCSTGHLFIHRNPKTRQQICWMYGKDGKWELANEDTCHPLYPDRVLHFRQNEEPSWWTRASKMTTRARVERRTTPSPSA